MRAEGGVRQLWKNNRLGDFGTTVLLARAHGISPGCPTSVLPLLTNAVGPVRAQAASLFSVCL